MDIITVLKEKAIESGLYECGDMAVEKIKFYPELRKACEVNTCRKYDTKWTCPPGVGTLEECKARLIKFNTMLLFSKKIELEDEFDIEIQAEDAGKSVKEFVDYIDSKLA